MCGEKPEHISSSEDGKEVVMSRYTVDEWRRIMLDMCPVIYKGIVYSRVYRMQFSNIRDPHHPDAPVVISFDLILLDKNLNSESTALPSEVEIWNESDRNRLFGTVKEGDADGQE